MRRSLLSVTLFVPALVFSQVAAYVETKVFQDPTRGALADVNIAVVGNSVAHAANPHGFQQARIQAITIIGQGETVVDFRKTEVNGPEHLDSAMSDFLHQEHFNLKPGEYDLEVELTDLNAPDVPAAKFKGPLVIAAPGNDLRFSDVLLTERVISDPSGSASLVPYISTYYPASARNLGFHVELYNADMVFGADSLFLLTYQISSYEDRKVVGSFRKQARAKAVPVIPITAQFDISALPSGNYLVVFEAADKQGKVLASQEQFVQRNNPVNYDMGALASADVGVTFADAYADKDTLAEYIRSLRPIATDLERKIIDDRWKDRDLHLMQRFFYSFWFNRNGYDPEGTWHRYEKLVAEVNRIYGCRIKRGYDTDRGYVHLKYGPPNTIMDQANDADGVPYQIWHYYRAGRYSDKRFVFYLPDRVTGCYELLHSEVPGEIKTPNWNQIIHATSVPMNNVQSTAVPLGHGEQVQDFFNTPR